MRGLGRAPRGGGLAPQPLRTAAPAARVRAAAAGQRPQQRQAAPLAPPAPAAPTAEGQRPQHRQTPPAQVGSNSNTWRAAPRALVRRALPLLRGVRGAEARLEADVRSVAAAVALMTALIAYDRGVNGVLDAIDDSVDAGVASVLVGLGLVFGVRLAGGRPQDLHGVRASGASLGRAAVAAAGPDDDGDTLLTEEGLDCGSSDDGDGGSLGAAASSFGALTDDDGGQPGGAGARGPDSPLEAEPSADEEGQQAPAAAAAAVPPTDAAARPASAQPPQAQLQRAPSADAAGTAHQRSPSPRAAAAPAGRRVRVTADAALEAGAAPEAGATLSAGGDGALPRGSSSESPRPGRLGPGPGAAGLAGRTAEGGGAPAPPERPSSRGAAGRRGGPARTPSAGARPEPQRRASGREQPEAAAVRRHRAAACQTRPEPAAAAERFGGDLSEWGRTALEGFYDDDGAGSEASSAPTMSSGLSPRGARPDAARPFSLDAAREALAYSAGVYGRGAALRRGGAAPAAGHADDLPTRIAYQQLSALAGMAGKVQEAILHNKRIFEQRMLQHDAALLRQALGGWCALRSARHAKRARLRRAAARIRRGALSRAFFAWRDELHLMDRTLAMRRKVAATVAAGCTRRCFAAWRRLAQERLYKAQLGAREREVAALEGKLRGYEKRPIQVLHKRRVGAMLGVWRAAACAARRKRAAAARAGRFCARRQQARVWRAWVEHVEAAARRRVLSAKLAARCARLELAAAWSAWLQALDARRERSSDLARAVQHRRRALAARAWRSWAAGAARRSTRRALAARWQRPATASVLAGWLAQRAAMATAFAGWADWVQQGRLGAKLAAKEGLEEGLAKLQAENERLRRDNERFVRLIDSGEWGRGRVAELASAGEVMRTERDALLALIGSLRREYEAVQAAKGAQEDELRALKERMALGGSARNRLLVKGGSSFNALVRAMKQDLLDSGAAARDPALAYEVDKLSMDHVQVFHDGELAVQAAASVGARSAPPLPGRAGGSLQTTAPAAAPAVAVARGSTSPIAPVRAGGAARRAGGGSLHTTLSVAAGGGPGSQRGRVSGTLAALSGLSAAQVDALEAAAVRAVPGGK
ncbi:hypothetical protein HT031_002223 [Scenedesmus sp. PABB004]|nr:hypothetical protein HT031_002223 [Scenedesmus sp. PABB004]